MAKEDKRDIFYCGDEKAIDRLRDWLAARAFSRIKPGIVDSVGNKLIGLKVGNLPAGLVVCPNDTMHEIALEIVKGYARRAP